MRNLVAVIFLTLIPLTTNAATALTVKEVQHACSQLVEQEKSWFGNMTTSKEEAFLAGRCEGAIKAIIEDSRSCYFARIKLVDAARRVARSNHSYSVPDLIRTALNCQD